MSKWISKDTFHLRQRIWLIFILYFLGLWWFHYIIHMKFCFYVTQNSLWFLLQGQPCHYKNCNIDSISSLLEAPVWWQHTTLFCSYQRADREQTDSLWMGWATVGKDFKEIIIAHLLGHKILFNIYPFLKFLGILLYCYMLPSSPLHQQAQGTYLILFTPTEKECCCMYACMDGIHCNYYQNY